MTSIQKEILSEKDERIKQLESRILKMQHEWNADLGQVVRERDKAVEYKDEAIRERNQAEAEVERLRQELSNIANARFYNFSGAEEFRTWAQSRARHAIGQEAGTLTVKKG